MTARTVKLSEKLVHKAKLRAKVLHRSTAGQIEYWAKIGRVSEENPDLPYSLIKDILISMEEGKSGDIEEYTFGEGE